MERNVITITLDWLAGTFKRMDKHAQTFCDLYARSPILQDATPRHGYSHSTVDGNGVQLLWNIDREEMGTHIVLPGSSLRALQQNSGVQLEALLSDAAKSNLSITRLDLAKDLTGQAVDGETIYQPLVRGGNEGTARTFGKIESNNGGYTIYIGSRQSERFCRIYNKAAQEQLQGELWWRFELETKGMVARAVAKSLVANQNWGGVFDTVALAMCRLPQSTDYGLFFTEDNPAVGIPKIERRSDREAWIEQQVIPAVAKHFAEHRDSAAVDRLITILTFIRDRQL